MLNTLYTLIKDNYEWRKQVGHLAVFELKKKQRGAVLGWSWFFVRPAVYIFCFWFALEVGLRAGSTGEGMPPYILWLAAGIIPWFFMQELITGGAACIRKYSHLVTKMKFPISIIPTYFNLISDPGTSDAAARK